VEQQLFSARAKAAEPRLPPCSIREK